MWNFITILKIGLTFFYTSQLCTCQLGQWKCFTKFENKVQGCSFGTIDREMKRRWNFFIKNNNSFGTMGNHESFHIGTSWLAKSFFCISLTLFLLIGFRVGWSFKVKCVCQDKYSLDSYTWGIQQYKVWAWFNGFTKWVGVKPHLFCTRIKIAFAYVCNSLRISHF